MRNINIPRPIGIPTPMAHERLCKCLAENWGDIRNHFEKMTSGDNIKISRIHVRKMKDTEALFLMNYKNWRIDGTPDPEITLGKKYVVHADISKCFPSIYSHAIPWALVGKNEAKKNNHNKSEWYNQIDYWTQRSKNGETHGLLIGPHTSNILSEIILCKIDFELKKKYEYIRNIDDYSCFVKSKDEADQFLIDLNCELEKYDLAINHKKTEICELPMATVEQWVNQIENKIVTFGRFQQYVDYKEVRSLIDYSINLMENNSRDTAILFYALKVLSGKAKDGQPKYNLTDNAKKYVVQKMVTLSLLYPYIVSWLDEYVFTPFGAEKEDIEKFAKLIYDSNLTKRNYEACSYSLYFAIKYDCCLDTVFDIDEVKKQMIVFFLY
ncbi:MAG: RNA-directed DNA polymerase [Lachnospiraceae bacterium]|nr:RNA-directed DNA polymerase [Lachnospiraceae bacterium]